MIEEVGKCGRIVGEKFALPVCKFRIGYMDGGFFRRDAILRVSNLQLNNISSTGPKRYARYHVSTVCKDFQNSYHPVPTYRDCRICILVCLDILFDP